MLARDHIVDPTPLELPLRKGVGVMLINRRGLVWTGRRRPKWVGDRSAYVWQMPQGGLDPGEDPLDAAYRELEEETGVRSVELIAELPHTLSYLLPEDLVGVALKGRYRGQEQRWFAMRFLGDDAEIDLFARGRAKAEFDRWKWRPIGELPELIVDFKRPLYEELVRAFSVYAKPE